MKSIRTHLVVAIGLLGFVDLSRAQTMPQDNWRYDGLEFASPEPDKYLSCIAIGSGGVYVGEGTSGSTTATRILQFTEGGAFVRRFDAVFSFVLGISCDSAGNVFVLDRGDSKVKAYAANGTFLRDWGGPGAGNGQFSFASTTGYNKISVDKNDQIYVCDPGNSRVQVFDTAGNFLRKWGEPGSLPGQFASSDPQGIATNPDGRVMIHCNNSPTLRIFDKQGLYLTSTYLNLTFMCVTPDGLLATGYSGDYIRFSDGRLQEVASSPVQLSSYGIATNTRGDLYRVVQSPKVVRVFEREYSNVHNPLLPTAMPQPTVTNIAQRAGVPLLDIDYKVTDADSSTVNTAALAFLNGNNTLGDVIPLSTLVEGTAANIGENQPVNVERRITWDMAADWSVDFAQIQVEVLTKDSRNPLGIHWITVPAEGNQPAIEISRAPVTDAALLSVWYWFIASRQPGMSFANAQVRGAGGVYGSSLFASGIATTNSGRVFAYEKMGFRGITGAEISRAVAGNYGFSSVTENSVVRDPAHPASILSAWGYNGQGQTNITPGLAGAGIGSIAAGNLHPLIITSNGELWGLGYNAYGQLGNGTTTQPTYPLRITTGVSQVTGGDNHTLFVKTDGTLWAMGRNNYGQLGDGSTTDRTTPVQVATGVSKVEAGENSSHFIKTDGTLWAMGYNGYGQLGDGSTTNRSTPVQISTNVAQVSAGQYHSLFIKNDGTLWATGYNNEGQLGDGTTTQRSSPVQVATGVAKIAAGDRSSLFIKTDETLWGMGSNNFGQLGDGTTTNRATPIQIASGVTEAVGANHSLFIKTDGTLWAMGYNGYGQLGDNTTTNRSSPVQVGAAAVRVAASHYFSLAVFGTP